MTPTPGLQHDNDLYVEHSPHLEALQVGSNPGKQHSTHDTILCHTVKEMQHFVAATGCVYKN